MNRRNLIAVLTCSFFVLAIVVTLISSGLSQSTGKGKSVTDNKSDSARKARRAVMMAFDKVKGDTITGWLFLDGEYIPGPYDITIEEGCVKVNGYSPSAQAQPPQMEQAANIDSSMVSQHYAVNALLDTFHTSVSSTGVEMARQRALQHIRTYSFVDSAHFVSNSDLCIYFRGMPAPLHVLLQAIGPRHEPSRYTADELKERHLKNTAGALHSWLISGHLVIVQSSGYRQSIGPPDGQIVFEKLRQIATNVDDLDVRIAEMRKIVPNDNAAASIARKFMRE